jgi:hypothetical protein
LVDAFELEILILQSGHEFLGGFVIAGGKGYPGGNKPATGLAR